MHSDNQERSALLGNALEAGKPGADDHALNIASKRSRIDHFRERLDRHDDLVHIVLHAFIEFSLLGGIALDKRFLDQFVQLLVIEAGTPALVVGELRLVRIVGIVGDGAQVIVRMRLLTAAAATNADNSQRMPLYSGSASIAASWRCSISYQMRTRAGGAR